MQPRAVWWQALQHRLQAAALPASAPHRRPARLPPPAQSTAAAHPAVPRAWLQARQSQLHHQIVVFPVPQAAARPAPSPLRQAPAGALLLQEQSQRAALQAQARRAAALPRFQAAPHQVLHAAARQFHAAALQVRAARQAAALPQSRQAVLQAQAGRIPAAAAQDPLIQAVAAAREAADIPAVDSPVAADSQAVAAIQAAAQPADRQVAEEGNSRF